MCADSNGTIRVDVPMFYRVRVTGMQTNLPGFAWIEPGTFTMGSPTNELDRSSDEGPLTEVTISEGFWMSKHEITQFEYQEIKGVNPSFFSGDPDRPVERVSWFDANDYCHRLTTQARTAGLISPLFEFRLPTEAEWEYACRAGSSTRFSYGDDTDYTGLGDHAWFGDNSGATTHVVEQKMPNAWGLHDMYGNVLEPRNT